MLLCLCRQILRLSFVLDRELFEQLEPKVPLWSCSSDGMPVHCCREIE